jgi:hypothetical protein
MRIPIQIMWQLLQCGLFMRIFHCCPEHMYANEHTRYLHNLRRWNAAPPWLRKPHVRRDAQFFVCLFLLE